MTSFGEELRRQRELREISLREIADATKINIRFLESLEKNDFKHLPGGQFNKGFIRAYARHIGVDGEGMVDAYLMEIRKYEDADKALGRGSSPRGRKIPAARPGLIAAGLFLVLVAALSFTGYWFLRRTKEPHTPPPAVQEGSTDTGKGNPPDASARARTGRTSSSEVAPPVDRAAGADGGAPALPAPGGAPATSPETGPVHPSPPGGSSRPLETIESTASRSASPISGPGDSHLPVTGEGAPLPPPTGAAPDAALTLLVMPFEKTRLGLLCNGKEAFSGKLEPGRPMRFNCSGVFEISTDDAGASNFSLNGERMYLGRRGQAIAGRHLSAANFADFTQPPAGDHPR